MRRRLAVLLVVVTGVAGLLIATGVLRLRVRLEPSDWVSASPFWREEPGPAALPPPLGLWVELARVVRPAVVNVSTLQRAPRQGPELRDHELQPALEVVVAAGQPGPGAAVEQVEGDHAQRAVVRRRGGGRRHEAGDQQQTREPEQDTVRRRAEGYLTG